MQAVQHNAFRGFPMARSIAFEDLATVVYVRVDDWYQGGRRPARPGRGQAPLQRQRGDHAPAAHGLGARPSSWRLCAGQPPGTLSSAAQPEPSWTAGLGSLGAPGRCAGLGGDREATRVALYLLDTKPMCRRLQAQDRSTAATPTSICASRNVEVFRLQAGPAAPRPACPRPTTWWRPPRTSEEGGGAGPGLRGARITGTRVFF